MIDKANQNSESEFKKNKHLKQHVTKLHTRL